MGRSTVRCRLLGDLGDLPIEELVLSARDGVASMFVLRWKQRAVMAIALQLCPKSALLMEEIQRHVLDVPIQQIACVIVPRC